jgi:putative nucleotidyltransferase with HDIG domain
MINADIPPKGSALPIPEVWLDRMRNCPQNPSYHAEGDVLAHTELVLEQLYKYKDSFQLSPSELRILYWSCLLHDIGKPKVTKNENGRITAGGHEYAGVHIARQVLLDSSDLLPHERRLTLDIVRWHYIPFRWSREERPEKDFYKMAYATDLRLISIFSLLDFHGRVCENQSESVRRIEHFHKVTEPKIRYHTGSHQEIIEQFRLKPHQHKDAIWYALGKEDFNLVQKLMDTPGADEKDTCHLLFTWALPGSGKSAWIQHNFPDTVVVQLKEFGLHAGETDAFVLDRRIVELKYHLNTLRRHFKEILIEGDTATPALYERLTDMSRKLSMQSSAVYLETQSEEWKSGAQKLYGTEYIQQQLLHFMQPHPLSFHHLRHETITWKNESKT